MEREPTYFEFVRLPSFERTAAGIVSEEEIRLMEQQLVADPRAGAVLADTGGVRKIRVARQGRGKSAGARVAYLYVEIEERIFLLLAFAKNAQPNLTAEQKRRMRELVKQIRNEGNSA
jgi:hypothetical protein